MLYVTGEESAAQVRLRAGRIHALAPTLLLVAETDLATVLGHIEQQDPDLLVVDSVQTIASAQVDGTAGGVSQVREVSAAVIQAAKARDMPVVLIGHVTKDGAVAGPRTLEHLVDVVCQFEGDRHSRLRMLRATKNRYGPTDEVGCFDLSEYGHRRTGRPVRAVRLPGRAPRPGHLPDRDARGSPTAGRRGAVAGRAGSPCPTRAAPPAASTAAGWPWCSPCCSARLGVRLADQDVYVSTIGGARVIEPAADLALALAAVSSRENVPLPARTGRRSARSGLAGEIRTVSGVGRRLAEAARLGLHARDRAAGALDGQCRRPG